MIDITNILTSVTFAYICIGIILICGIGCFYHFMNKGNNKRKQKHNTKELNKYLSSDVNSEGNMSFNTSSLNNGTKPIQVEPVTIIDNEIKSNVDVVDELTSLNSKENKITFEDEKDNSNLSQDMINNNLNNNVNNSVNNVNPVIEVEPITFENTSSNNVDSNASIESDNIENSSKDEIVYAPIELNKEEAKEELEKITKELEKKNEENLKEVKLNVQDSKVDDDSNNIQLTDFEREQEENAIISLDELMNKAQTMYQENEIVQYDDEGDEPISIADLQAKWEKEQQMIKKIEVEENKKQVISEKNEPVIDDKNEQVITVIPIKEDNNINISLNNKEKPIKKVVFPSIRPLEKEAFSTKFENSPIISPVYGFERKKAEEIEKLNPSIISSNELELENTANYEKFDEEIKKTNEFIAALKELQKKLD